MRSDLDRLMAERALDVLIIPNTEAPNPLKDYLTGGVRAHVMVVKKRGEAPVVIANAMEVEEAAKSGLEVLSFDEFNLAEIWKQYGRDTFQAQAAWWGRIFERLAIRGRVSFYGATDMQTAFKLHEILSQHLPQGDFEIVTDTHPNLFEVAQETKDAEELARLRSVGERASAVMQATRAWLGQHRLENGQVVNVDGQPLTIDMVKRFVRSQLMERDLEDSEGMIFAQGRDAGLPHNKGRGDEVLRAGESIVFDLFPREIGGGYFHDMTRTWCLGYAPAHIQKAYDLVLEVYWKSLEGIEIGQPVKKIATQVCEWFEAAGHPTRLNTPYTNDGYVHALGHGMGMFIHEKPTISHAVSDNVLFQAGNLLTIEPGLYYPNLGYGIRVEDTVYLDEHGDLQKLTDCSYELVIALQGQ